MFFLIKQSPLEIAGAEDERLASVPDDFQFFLGPFQQELVHPPEK
jgi:hypothetical protein